MPRYVALLRAVNLGGSTHLDMGDLRRRLTESGFEDVRTLLQSGNIALRTRTERRGTIERRIEAVLARSFELRTDCFVRTAPEWRQVIDSNPFPREAEEDPGHTTVLVLKHAAPPSAWKGLEAIVPRREIVRGRSDHGYVVYPDGLGRSRLTLARIERALGTRGTIRNWNTVAKLGSLLAA